MTFSAEGGGQEGEEEREESKKRKQVGKYGLVLLLMQKTQQAFLKHESPLMELGDKPSHTHAGRVYVCVCVALQHM